jgi:hypothetical protein
MENSENLGFMYGQNIKNFSKFVWIAAGMHQKSQNFHRLPIWPQKNPNLSGLANQVSKNAKFVQIGLQNGNFTWIASGQCSDSIL